MKQQQFGRAPSTPSPHSSTHSPTHSSSSSTPTPSIDQWDQQLEAALRVLHGDPTQARTFLRSQPALTHSLATVSDDTLDQQLDTFRAVDPHVLRQLYSAVKPLLRGYQAVDVCTGGRGKYVLCVVFVVLVGMGVYLTCLCWGWFWACWGYVSGGVSEPAVVSSGVSGGVSGSGVSGSGVSSGVSGGAATAPLGVLSGHNDGDDEFEF
jgi:hypothetical protein